MLLACVPTTSASPSSLMAKADAHEPSASYVTVCLPRFAIPGPSSTYSRPI